jgi:protein-S-isoprenylcysteine O-methyltransferase Ste14
VAEIGKLRWSNIPVPEGHLAALGLGILVHRLRPASFAKPTLLRGLLGWATLLTGVLLSGWAVLAARETELEQPDQLVMDGPYRFSRNPMYLAWTIIYIGISLLLDNRRLLHLLPALILYTHKVVLEEESQLEQHFSDAYQAYRDSVSRYLSIKPPRI